MPRTYLHTYVRVYARLCHRTRITFLRTRDQREIHWIKISRLDRRSTGLIIYAYLSRRWKWDRTWKFWKLFKKNLNKILRSGHERRSFSLFLFGMCILCSSISLINRRLKHKIFIKDERIEGRKWKNFIIQAFICKYISRKIT